MREFIVLCVSAFTVGWLVYALAKSKATRTGMILGAILYVLAMVGLAIPLLNLLAWVGL